MAVARSTSFPDGAAESRMLGGFPALSTSSRPGVRVDLPPEPPCETIYTGP
jgi:hypothetical protein